MANAGPNTNGSQVIAAFLSRFLPSSSILFQNIYVTMIIILYLRELKRQLSGTLPVLACNNLRMPLPVASAIGTCI